MHIFVINLEKDAARRDSISRQLDLLGLPYEFVPAVYGAGLSDEERSRVYDERKAKYNRSRPLVPAEIGCALSHLKCYRAMVERGIACALVLEDDVVLPGDLKEFLADCEKCLDTAAPSVWLLSPAEGWSMKDDAAQITPSHQLLPYRAGYFASSYILTRAAANALHKELYPVSDVADCWKKLDRYKVVDLFVVSPAVIEQDQGQFGSSTTADYKSVIGGSLFDKSVYKLRRLREVVWNLFYAPYRRRFHPYADTKPQGQRIKEI